MVPSDGAIVVVVVVVGGAIVVVDCSLLSLLSSFAGCLPVVLLSLLS